MKTFPIQQATFVLESGGVIAHATETCYGFACDALSKKALARLYKLKKMPKTKPISLMVADLKMAKKYGNFTRRAEELARKYWPGPLTIIVKRKKALPAFLNPRAKTVGFRVPAHKSSLMLLKKFGGPLTTTSANISGQPATYSASAIKKQFRGSKQKPDYIIDSGTIKKNPPSTIIDLSSGAERVVRKGGILM